jgi:hypothetical protein
MSKIMAFGSVHEDESECKDKNRLRTQNSVVGVINICSRLNGNDALK